MKQNRMQRSLGSARETTDFGKRFGQLLRAGDVVALKGNLGAGKTTWVKGACRGLNVPPATEVASPTYTVIHEYQGRERIFHLDWYRLDRVRDTDEDLAQECFGANAVTFVEWAERGRKLLPPQTLWMEFLHVSPTKRSVMISLGKRTRPELAEAVRGLL